VLKWHLLKSSVGYLIFLLTKNHAFHKLSVYLLIKKIMPSDALGLDPLVAVGFIGALTVIVGFVMNQLGLWKVNDFEYDLINAIGGAVLVFYSYRIGNWPFFALFVVWFLFSLKDCLLDYRHRFDWKTRKRKK